MMLGYYDHAIVVAASVCVCVYARKYLGHNYWDSLNPIFNCGSTIESTKHYLLHCLNFKNERKTFLQNVRIINPNLLAMNEDELTHFLLCGNNTLTDNTNTFLLSSIIEYITF